MTIRRSEAESPASIPEPPDPAERLQTGVALPEGSTLDAVAKTTLGMPSAANENSGPES